MLSITLDSIIFPHRRSNVYLRQTGYGSPCCWEMRVDDVWDDCVTSLSVSCHEIGVGRRKELYLAHILGHYLFVVVNAWCNSSSRSKWMYYIEGTKMVLVCCSGSSKPEKMYLEQACSSRAEKVSCVLLKFLGLWDDSDFGCLNLLAGISWRCCVERCPFPHQVLLIGEKSSLMGIIITWSWVGDHSFIEDKVLLKGIYWLPQFDSQFKDNGW